MTLEKENWDAHCQGKTWTSEMLETLIRYWEAGVNIDGCARTLGRTRLSIVCKLQNLAYPAKGVTHLRSDDANTWYNLNKPTINTGICDSVTTIAAAKSSNENEKTTGETKMNKFEHLEALTTTIEQVTKSLTLDDFTAEIVKIEAQLDKLQSLKTKPKAVRNKIASLEAQLNALSTQCDELLAGDE